MWALQRSLFNRWLTERLDDGLRTTVLAGDVLEKTTTGGLFVSTEPAVDQARLDAGELALTGPMFGAVMKAPTVDSAAHAREARLLAAVDLGVADFARLGNLASGTRRTAALRLTDAAVEELAPDAIRVTFSLPAGAYATAILREVQKSADGFGHDHPPASDDPVDPGDADAPDPEPHASSPS